MAAAPNEEEEAVKLEHQQPDMTVQQPQPSEDKQATEEMTVDNQHKSEGDKELPEERKDLVNL